MSLFSSNANIQPNEWNHIAFTYNKETSNVNLFVNNKIVNGAKLEIELSKSLSDFNIGYSSNVNDGEAYFNGTIDEILLYNRELNPKELEYVSKSNNTDLFLKNLVGGRWSFDEFTTQVNNLLDNSGNNNTAVSSGNVTRGSTPAFGNHSIVFDGSSTVSAPNASLNTGYMSVGAWIKPTAHGETYIKKEGVFDVGIRSDGYPKMTIGDVSSETNIKIQKHVQTQSPINIHEIFNISDILVYYNASVSNAIQGTQINDLSGNGRHMNMIQGTTTVVDNAFVFDGTNWLETSNIGNTGGNWSHSISCWVKFDEWPISSTGNEGWNVFNVGDGTTRIAYVLSGLWVSGANQSNNIYWTSWAYNLSLPALQTTNTWFHVCLVLDGTTGKTVYLNGVQIATMAKSDDLNIVEDTVFQIGNPGFDHITNNRTVGFKGKIKDIAVFNKTLTESEVNTIYTTNVDFSTNNLNKFVHFALENDTKDSTGLNSDAVGHNLTYNTDSYNTYVGHTCAELNGTNSYLDCGKVFQNVSDPNKMTLSMWVNMSELDSDKKYPLMSASNGFEWYLTKPSSGPVDTYQNFEIKVPIDFGVFATTWRITWTQEANAGYMRTGEVGIYDEYYEPTTQHSPLSYTSINPSNWNVIYDGNAGQYDLQNNNGPYSYTITFQNAIQLKQLKLGSTDGGANNSLSGHPSKSVKFEYQLENGSFVEHSTLVMKDITSGENGTETFNTNSGNYPWKVTNTTFPLIGMYGMDMFRWNGSKWYHYQSYGDNMVINYPKTIGSTTYY